LAKEGCDQHGGGEKICGNRCANQIRETQAIFAKKVGEYFINNSRGNCRMPRGDKSKYTDKQKRQAEHIEAGYKDQGVPKDEAEKRAWATVNKESGGGKKSGSGRKKSTD
jgi:hypothetical protein